MNKEDLTPGTKSIFHNQSRPNFSDVHFTKQETCSIPWRLRLYLKYVSRKSDNLRESKRLGVLELGRMSLSSTVSLVTAMLPAFVTNDVSTALRS